MLAFNIFSLVLCGLVFMGSVLAVLASKRSSDGDLEFGMGLLIGTVMAVVIVALSLNIAYA